MQRPFTPFFFIFVFLFSVACHRTSQVGKEAEVTIENSENAPSRKMDSFTFLRLCMQGEFSSQAQSLEDKDYFDIRLRMIPIWPDSGPDAFYLYVEQSVATSLEKPYRQRIYKVVRVDDMHFVSHIYTMPQPERFTGKKSDDAIFKTFEPDSLQLKEGCEVHLTYVPEKSGFTGSTGEKTCPSDRSGAAWATSKVDIDEEKMVSWDQGWDVAGNQVWGAKKGGYIFMKNR